ncbi:MAG: VOC family protein [Flavimaricola sp.]|nr:VOC family protein [Flavimaricola sp.]
MIEDLDHINIRTSRLAEMIDWYDKVLGMKPGPRPDFSFPGAWLYAKDQAMVHVVEVKAEPGSDPDDLKLEHGAFRATGFDEFIAKLDRMGEKYELTRVPTFPIVQVNIWDPDGNHLHIDFHADEAPAV